MKKYLMFILSFMLLFSLVTLSIQLLSGIILTSTYTPDVSEAWNASAILPQEIEIISSGSPFLFRLLSVFLSATVAYFISQKFTKRI